MVKISLQDLETAVAYLRANSSAYGLHVKEEDLVLSLSTVDLAGQIVEVQLFDMDRSKSKAKLVQTVGLEIAAKIK
jgi:hypothetical protein